MIRKILIVLIAVLGITALVYAVESSKPSSHDTSWIQRHGKYAKLNIQECTGCHTDKVSCIKCHQEVKPRNHTLAWTRKGHGLEAKWDRGKCSACHTEDSCIECHKTTPPPSHRPGYAAPTNRHCTQCHYPVQDTTCFTCHKVAHAPNQYQ